jgi:hypothetical protein
MESSDEPEAYQDQLELHAAQGSQDLPLQSDATIERNQPVEELAGSTASAGEHQGQADDRGGAAAAHLTDRPIDF